MNLITTKEAAEILDMHSNSVMYHAKQGNLVGHKVFNEWRYDSAEVQKFKKEVRTWKNGTKRILRCGPRTEKRSSGM